MSKKKAKKPEHLKLVSTARTDQQVSEAVAALLASENMAWEEAQQHLKTLQQHLNRALPRLDQAIRGSDLAQANTAVYALSFLEGQAADDMLMRYVDDNTLDDDLRMSAFSVAQQREIDVDAGEFFASLHDADGVFRRSRDRLLAQTAMDLPLRQSIVESIVERSPEELAGWLELITEPKDPRALHLLLPLLHLPDVERALLVIEALDQLGHPAAAPVLAELAEYHTSPGLCKAARAAQGRLTMRASARPAVPPLPLTPLPPLERAYLTTLDGDGGQAIGVVRRQEDGLLTLTSIAVNDHQGVRTCFAHDGVPPDDWAAMLDDLGAEGNVPVDMPLSTCRRTLEEARHFTMQEGLPLPLAAEAWRDMFQGEDLPGVEEPTAPALPAAEAAQLLEDTDDLIDEIYFFSWFFNPEELEPFMDEAERLEEERWGDRWEQFVGKVLRRLITSDKRGQLRARLEREAALLAGLGQEDLARLTVAAAWGLSKESGIKLQEHPFLREMVEAGFDNVWEGGDEDLESGEWDEEESEEEEEEGEEATFPDWHGPLPETESAWRAFIATAQSPVQVLDAWFEKYPPTDRDQINEAAAYLLALWNTTPRPELGGRSPAQVSGIPTPALPPMPNPPVVPPGRRATAVLLQPPPGPTTLDDVLETVHEYYEGIDWEPLLVEESVVGYLRDAHEGGESPDDLMARWSDLEFFHLFLDHGGEEIQTLDDVRPHHLSDWVTDFVKHEVPGGMPLDDKRHALETVHALYAYLARVGDVDKGTAQTVGDAVARITKPKRTLARIDNEGT